MLNLVFKDEFYSVMNKNKQVIDDRRQFVAAQVKRRSKEKVESVVRKVANELFLSEATIWNDLRNSKL